MGVIKMAAQLNTTSTSFDCAVDNLARTVQVSMSGEQLRKLVVAAGSAVLEGQRTGAIPTAFQRSDCPVDLTQQSGPTRICAGVAGVMVPAITDVEKLKRWEENQTQAAVFGTEVLPVAAALSETDEQFKEFRTVTFSDETGEYWNEQRTRGRWPTIGLLVRHEAKRLGFSAADEKIANIGGVTRIRNQLTAWLHDLPLDSLGANFYHLAKNVHKSRRIV